MVQYGGEDRDLYFFSVYDPTAYFTPVFELVERQWQDYQVKIEREFSWNDEVRFPDGRLRVDMSSGDNGNHWAAVRLAGAVGITPRGRVNRDAIGAVITFTPDGGRTVMAPVLGGSSHLSQDSLTQSLGLGSADEGTLEILWPGGVRNRLYGVSHTEHLVVPELACSYDTSDDLASYTACVDQELAALQSAGALAPFLADRMRTSALSAYADFH
jgi:hypothetical protein